MGNRCGKVSRSPAEAQLSDFTLIRSIGAGTYAQVYIVYHRGLKKHYALRSMVKRRLVNLIGYNVLREIEILKELSHPFIVNLFFCFQDELYFYMISDFLIGGDLRWHLNENGRFSEARAKLYICEIALAIDYLHSRQICHRDLKPENILLDEQGHAHLTDFNLATKLEKNKLATSFSGTKPYCAPEIVMTALGQIPGYGLYVDWYSLGVCAYEMNRGRRPYEFSSSCPTQVLRILQNSSIILPESWPSDLRSFITNIMHLNLTQRITTFESFRKHRYMERIDFDRVLARKQSPVFVPRKNRLYCDPTYELESRIVESYPLHKHHQKRLRFLRQRKNSSDTQSSRANKPHADAIEEAVRELSSAFVEYNRFRTNLKTNGTIETFAVRSGDSNTAHTSISAASTSQTSSCLKPKS
ncbi:Serine/threonine-protein kinase 32A [Aphelenchoides besseyi]|nr:Serine/threonine-protein kinase 32A [Aphelenchoides besseyi]KAI6200916.1 Serine/threonine-protein kinase 32A [Aphelenchoides besseyi]